MKLSNTELLRKLAFVDGKWTGADAKETFTVENPFDQQIIAELPEMGTVETRQAIEAANAAFKQWSELNPNKRANMLNRWSQLMMDNIDDLATILTSEQGKPWVQAKSELEYAAAAVAFYAGEAMRISGQTLPAAAPNAQTLVIRQPYGVVGCIAPWNFPTIMVTKMAAAMAAGNCVVAKPAEDTPLTPLALAYLAEQAGIPAGVFNMVVAKQAKPIGDELTSNEKVRMLTFTGSTQTGKLLYAQCANTVKKVILELGGNSPFIVFADADIDAAVEQSIGLKFRNCGQICVTANRFFIHETVFDKFLMKFISQVKKIKLGSGLDEKTTMGPLINSKGLEKVEALVMDAIKKGAKVEIGGKLSDAGKLFYEPTILTNMNSQMRAYHEEIFGPIAALYRFKEEAEVIAMANNTEYGLAAYFYTLDLARAWRVSTALESGGVNINTGGGFGGGPFGGYKQSGIGREGGRIAALDEYCQTKTISIET